MDLPKQLLDACNSKDGNVAIIDLVQKLTKGSDYNLYGKTPISKLFTGSTAVLDNARELVHSVCGRLASSIVHLRAIARNYEPDILQLEVKLLVQQLTQSKPLEKDADSGTLTASNTEFYFADLCKHWDGLDAFKTETMKLINTSAVERLRVVAKDMSKFIHQCVKQPGTPVAALQPAQLAANAYFENVLGHPSEHSVTSAVFMEILHDILGHTNGNEETVTFTTTTCSAQQACVWGTVYEGCRLSVATSQLEKLLGKVPTLAGAVEGMTGDTDRKSMDYKFKHLKHFALPKVQFYKKVWIQLARAENTFEQCRLHTTAARATMCESISKIIEQLISDFKASCTAAHQLAEKLSMPADFPTSEADASALFTRMEAEWKFGVIVDLLAGVLESSKTIRSNMTELFGKGGPFDDTATMGTITQLCDMIDRSQDITPPSEDGAPALKAALTTLGNSIALQAAFSPIEEGTQRSDIIQDALDGFSKNTMFTPSDKYLAALKTLRHRE